ncbi:MAG: hypothetical protein B6I24_06020 [Bacteroidetes bacterium 4572_128]|nr:MAG: hypothetical protein B6I24_06020 [Bacteroidetes bacterium 4572_128]
MLIGEKFQIIKKNKMKEKNFFNYNFIIPVFLLIFLFSCSDKESNDSSRNDGGSETGKGGSMARFAIKGDRLYIVDNEYLNMFDITEVSNPNFILKKHIGFNIETIFPKDTLLFIGSQNGIKVATQLLLTIILLMLLYKQQEAVGVDQDM